MYVQPITLLVCVICWIMIGITDKVHVGEFVISTFILVLIFQLDDIKTLLKEKNKDVK